ncbi:MAG: aconitate hydratase 2/2-methylisocitrate dehydratase [Colwellia sp.]|jgi:aconitate hydratase 2/2-methylisocitrate dehydratase
MSYSSVFIAVFGGNFRTQVVTQGFCHHVAERAAMNIPPKLLDAEQFAGLVGVMKTSPAAN